MEIKDTKVFEITSIISIVEDDLEKSAGASVIAGLETEFYLDFLEYSVDHVLYGASGLDYDDTQPSPEDNLVSLGLVPVEAQGLLKKWEEATRDRFYNSGVATNAKYDFREYDYELSFYPQNGSVFVKVETTTPLEEGAATRL